MGLMAEGRELGEGNERKVEALLGEVKYRGEVIDVLKDHYRLARIREREDEAVEELGRLAAMSGVAKRVAVEEAKIAACESARLQLELDIEDRMMTEEYADAVKRTGRVLGEGLTRLEVLREVVPAVVGGDEGMRY